MTPDLLPSIKVATANARQAMHAGVLDDTEAKLYAMVQWLISEVDRARAVEDPAINYMKASDADRGEAIVRLSLAIRDNPRPAGGMHEIQS